MTSYGIDVPCLPRLFSRKRWRANLLCRQRKRHVLYPAVTAEGGASKSASLLALGRKPHRLITHGRHRERRRWRLYPLAVRREKLLRQTRRRLCPNVQYSARAPAPRSFMSVGTATSRRNWRGHTNCWPVPAPNALQSTALALLSTGLLIWLCSYQTSLSEALKSV